MKRFNKNSDFNEVMEYLNENADDVTTYDQLADFAKQRIDDGMLSVAIHVLTSIYEDKADGEWFLYDFCMGTLEKPAGVDCFEDVKHLLEDLDAWEENEE